MQNSTAMQASSSETRCWRQRSSPTRAHSHCPSADGWSRSNGRRTWWRAASPSATAFSRCTCWPVTHRRCKQSLRFAEPHYQRLRILSPAQQPMMGHQSVCCRSVVAPPVARPCRPLATNAGAVGDGGSPDRHAVGGERRHRVGGSPVPAAHRPAAAGPALDRQPRVRQRTRYRPAGAAEVY